MKPNHLQPRELPLIFQVGREQLVGILHAPEAAASTAVLIIVGGPQYRVGSHRQFVLLARKLAEEGFPCMRFDYRGMGDSEGEQRSFEFIHEDIQAAVNCMIERCPNIEKLVLWGLCDGATAAVSFATGNNQIAGLVLLNPWVRTEQSEAATYVKHYYLHRLRQKSFWLKFARRELSPSKVLSDFTALVKKAARKKTEDTDTKVDLPTRFIENLNRCEMRTLLILSGNDLTAKEFTDLRDSSTKLGTLLARQSVSEYVVHEADHTFSEPAWSSDVENQTVHWLKTHLAR